MGAVLKKFLRFDQLSGNAVSKIKYTAFFAAVVMVLTIASGCTDIERRGYSPIPQNSSPSWSNNPYGDIRN